VIITGAANQSWFKGQPRWPRGQYLGMRSSILCSTILRGLAVLNHTEVELQDFKVDHNKFLMLLCLSEYRNRQISNACNFGYGGAIFKKIDSFRSGEKVL